MKTTKGAFSLPALAETIAGWVHLTSAVIGRCSMLPRLVCLLVCSSLLTPAAHIYVTASGHATLDDSLQQVLQSFGHSVTLGVPYYHLNGTQDLASMDVVYLQANHSWGNSWDYGWAGSEMPAAGQTALVNFVNQGGGLVTTEWLLWIIEQFGTFAILNPILPVNPTVVYDYLTVATFTQDVPKNEINAGLPGSFSAPLDYIDGTRTLVSVPRAGASSFYKMNGGFIALAGWNVGNGRVLSFTTLNGQEQLANGNFRQLLSNTLTWAGAGQTPLVSETGVVNAATFAARQAVAPGSLVSIFGSGLASSHVAANSTSLPNTLGGVSVTFNGIAAPLLFVSPHQINAQVPWAVLGLGTTSGTALMVVRRGLTASEARPVQIAPVSPGIFSVESGVGQAIAVNADGSLSAPAGLIPGVPSAPARVGTTIMVLATGLGVVDPPGRDGQASLDAQRRTLTAPTVLIGGTQAVVQFSGLSPQFPGVNQLNVVVPPVAPADLAPIQIRIGDITTTDRITIAVAN